MGGVAIASASGAFGAPSAVAEVRTGQRSCAKCGEPIVRRRIRASHDLSLCLRCEQKARAAAYFQMYYTSNKDRILNKNRRWAKDHGPTLAERRRARAAQKVAEPKACIDCGTAVARAERCRRCHIRHRYATDPQYRAHRLSITRRWLDKREA
jgi:hypothetical protein